MRRPKGVEGGWVCTLHTPPLPSPLPPPPSYATVRSENKVILNVAYRQGLLFKNFKDSNKLGQMLQQSKVSKLTPYFKVKQVKLLDKYPKIKSSSLSLNFFKDYAKTIKEFCKESELIM